MQERVSGLGRSIRCLVMRGGLCRGGRLIRSGIGGGRSVRGGTGGGVGVVGSGLIWGGMGGVDNVNRGSGVEVSAARLTDWLLAR